jgi:transcriptional regulator with XRE-family HTH domain
MEKGVNMVKAHDWVNHLRERERITFKALGACLNMTDRGLSNALKNNTLSLSKIEKIAKEFNVESEFNEQFGTKENYPPEEVLSYEEELPEGHIQIKDVPEFIVKNEKTLAQNHVFKLWLKTKVQEGVIKILGK